LALGQYTFGQPRDLLFTSSSSAASTNSMMLWKDPWQAPPPFTIRCNKDHLTNTCKLEVASAPELPPITRSATLILIAHKKRHSKAIQQHYHRPFRSATTALVQSNKNQSILEIQFEFFSLTTLTMTSASTETKW
jgi:hypothetical protein